MNKKLFVTGITILFLGLAFAPSIHANISKESELVEITTEVCGLPGQKPQTVQLTKEDAEAVDRLFDEIKLKLDNVESREDTVEIFNKAVVELDKYRLLGGLSVEEAQKLVTGFYQNPRIIYILEKLNPKPLDENLNAFCLIVGRASNTFDLGLISLASVGAIILNAMAYNTIYFFLMETSFGQFLLEKFPIFFWLLFGIDGVLAWFLMLFLASSFFSPLKAGGFTTFGIFYEDDLNPPDYFPAEGNILTVGLNGIKSWDGTFYGQVLSVPIIYCTYYLGAIGFTGLRIGGWFGNKDTFYLGSALWVQLDSTPI